MTMTAMTAPVEIDPRERERLRLALRPAAMAAQLSESLGLGRTRSTRASACHILDVKYEPGGRGTVLYELNDHLVLGVLGQGDPSEPGPAGSVLITRLGMRAYLFPHDPYLPGLVTAMDREAMKRVLEQALAVCRTGEARVLGCRVELLRYRPARRCTLRLNFWLRPRSGALEHRVIYAKLYHDTAKAAAVYEDLGRLSAAEPLRAAGVLVSRPAAFVPELGMVLQEPLVGVPLAALLEGPAGPGRQGISGVVAAAGAMAELHSAGHAPVRRRPPAPALEKMRRRAASVRLVDAALGRRMEDLACALASGVETLDDLGAELRTVHGDCKPSQFLISPSHVAILDFDHCGLADPASDVGDFTAALRKTGVQRALAVGASNGSRRQVARLRALEETFVAAYPGSRGERRGFRRRVNYYQAVGLLRKAYRAFQRSPSSPLPAALVDEGWRCLEADPPTPRGVRALEPAAGALR